MRDGWTHGRPCSTGAFPTTWWRPSPHRPDRFSAVIPIFDDKVGFDVAADRVYRVASDGAVMPVTFQPSLGGTLIDLGRAGTATIQGGTWEQRGASTCVIPGGGSATLQIEPHPSLRGKGPWWVRTRYTSPTSLVSAPNVGLGYAIGGADRCPLPRSGRAAPCINTLPGPGRFNGIRFLISVPGLLRLCRGRIAPRCGRPR